MIKSVFEEEEEIQEKLLEAKIDWADDGQDNMINEGGFFMRMSEQ